MEINEIAASASAASASSTQASHELTSAKMAKDQFEEKGEQVMQLLEVTAPGKLRTDPLSPLGTYIDLEA